MAFEKPFLVKSAMHAAWLPQELGDSLVVPLAGGAPGLRGILLDLLGQGAGQALYLVELAGGLDGQLEASYRGRVLAQHETLQPGLGDSRVYAETAEVLGTRGGFTTEAYRIDASNYHLVEPIILGAGRRRSPLLLSIPAGRSDWFPVLRFPELLKFNGRFSNVAIRGGIDYTPVLTAYCRTVASIGGCPIFDLSDAEARNYLGILGTRIPGRHEAVLDELPDTPIGAQERWVLRNLMEGFTTSPWLDPQRVPPLQKPV